MDNLLREGEQFLENQANGQGNDQGQQSNQQGQQGQQDQQGGSMMKNFEQNAGDAYINQEVNKFLNNEGVPAALDGAIDGVIDTEVNNLEKRFQN
ncbi:uncharacterized protein Z519_04674 [Cladophialophora bantiana CBS 173.52]|uniref:Uncharacterized protein n=1 Tax=Cladophialophora bantiana (strain ATCC 10958 / CBS 173.52 / CDC B-1940 / NIH 8579) TaxID=1442370 RepID=A0A0D2G7S5_CLAB1|nr:uncharacterized protein Z519_04674 [Cladophialophora bantiana CBS 173.52]KIW94697.1 hypothetical protein Z519_04674 [Cladophialophora bantiana CBS 173.52]